MIKFEQGGHWYRKDGTPRHNVDLRVARKELLYPSVTTIDRDVFKNPFLDAWKLEQVALAAAATFKQPHESEEDYIGRIYENSLWKPRAAADFGTQIHDALERYPVYPGEARLHPWVDQFGAWYNLNMADTVARECVLVDHELGVAGRCDFIGHGRGSYETQLLLGDFKTQGCKRDKKGVKQAAYYDSWPRQLAFYAVCYSKQVGTFPDALPTCVSLVFDSEEPLPPFVKVWSKEEILKSYRQFVSGAWLWFDKRNYWPCGPWQLNPSIPMPI